MPAPDAGSATRRVLALAALYIGSWPAWAAAQVPLQAALNRPVEVNFAPPGARSLGVGGTFIGLADDATAAESNAAGLILLSRPELSAHVRAATYNTSRPHDIVPGIVESYTDSVWSASFVSAVVPLGRFALAFYYHEPSNFKSHSFADGIVTPATFEGGFVGQLAVAETNNDFVFSKLGVAGATRVHRRVAVGGSLTWGRVERHAVDRMTLPLVAQESTAATRSVSSDLVFNVGVLVNPGGGWSAGFVYKEGASLDYSVTRTNRTPRSVQQQSLTFSRKLPDVIGSGLAVRPTDRLTLLFDVLRIEYDSLNVARQVLAGLALLEPALELHFGGEYFLFAGRNPVALRAGVYTNPDHDIFQDVNSDQVHGTFGIGFVLEGRAQFDVAASLARGSREVAISTNYRF